ncbi:hypothetical protein [Angustibacter aerolatus]
MDVPERLLAHASVALEDAAAMLSLGGRGGSFPPTVLTDSGHGVERARFVGDDNRIGLEQARRHVRETVRSGVVAISWDGLLHLDGGKVDAIMVEVSDDGGGPGVLVARCYRPAGRLRGLRLDDDAAVLEDDRPPMF